MYMCMCSVYMYTLHIHICVYMLHACALSRSKTTDELTLTTYAVGGRGGVMVSGDQG